MITVSIEKMKYSTSEIQKVINYIANKYPQLIEKETHSQDVYSYVKFKSGEEFFPLETECFKTSDKIAKEFDRYIYVNDKNSGKMKNEFLFGELNNSHFN